MRHAQGLTLLTVHPMLTGLVTFIARFFNARLSSLHIKGNSGNPWDELADFTTKSLLATKLEPAQTPFEQIKELVSATGLHEWGLASPRT